MNVVFIESVTLQKKMLCLPNRSKKDMRDFIDDSFGAELNGVPVLSIHNSIFCLERHISMKM